MLLSSTAGNASVDIVTEVMGAFRYPNVRRAAPETCISHVVGHGRMMYTGSQRQVMIYMISSGEPKGSKECYGKHSSVTPYR